ncbi:MAG: hypothetical protein QY320_01355 [Gammaproteobacteria bacterium]|nr:MAG: hypothetical protein QY320_01355 [Gammaproteobacteria bacterium]
MVPVAGSPLARIAPGSLSLPYLIRQKESPANASAAPAMFEQAFGPDALLQYNARAGKGLTLNRAPRTAGVVHIALSYWGVIATRLWVEA